jgi:hypothetical protein
MLEKEIWSQISKEKFEESIEYFTNKFGNPEIKKRLALQATDYNRMNLDTRIRITNGQAEIMQKSGSWTEEVQEEISVCLPKDAVIILNTYKVLLNMLQSDNIQTSIIQFENFIFDTEEYELKLTHQFGKVDVYNYEIEVKDITKEPKIIALELKLPLNLPENTSEFWKQWNRKVNLSAKDLTDKELLAIISKYL